MTLFPKKIGTYLKRNRYVPVVICVIVLKKGLRTSTPVLC